MGCCCAAARHAVQDERKHHRGIVAAAVIGALAALAFVIILIVALVKMQRKTGWVPYTVSEHTLTRAGEPAPPVVLDAQTSVHYSNTTGKRGPTRLRLQIMH